MYIATGKFIDDLKFDNSVINKAGIIDRRRVIHIFYDPALPFNCKVIQINISTTVGSSVTFDNTFISKDNGNLSFVGVYVYDCKLNTIDKTLVDQFKHGNLTVLSAKRLDRETNFNSNETYSSDAAQVYSTCFKNYSVSDYVESRMMPNPKYYTFEQEYYETGEYPEGNSIIEDFSINLIGMDIIDDITEIYQQSPDSFRTIRDTMMISDNETLFGPRGEIESSAADSICRINQSIGCDSMVNGGLFVYDSQLGLNFKDASIINKKYMTETNAGVELQTFLTMLEVRGRAIEKEHGNIYMLYSPSLTGSKCRIIYKDYNNAISDNLSKASKDSSYEVTEFIGEKLDADDGIMVHKYAGIEGVNYPFPERERLMSYYDN